MKAHLFVDLSSMQHLIAAAHGHSGRRQLHLKSLIANLQRRGLEVGEVSVALATNALLVDDESNADLALKGVERDLNWLQGQQRELGREIRALPGGFDGRHEVGVDEVLVGGALSCAHTIATQGVTDEQLVVVVTNDADMNHLAPYAYPAQIVLCGHFVSEEGNHTLDRLRRAKVPFINLTSDEVRSLGLSDPTLIPEGPLELGESFSIRPRREERVLRGPAVALVDAYGIACTAGTALGISHLPTTTSVRSVLERFDFPRNTRLLLSVPDLRMGRYAAEKLGDRTAEAWVARDTELDELAQQARAEPVYATRVRRGELRPGFQGESELRSLRRDSVLRTAKRNTTLIAAELTRLVLQRPTTKVVVVSDEPPLAYFQSVLAQITGKGATSSQVVRVGAVAATARLVDGEIDRRVAGDYIVLTQGDLAELVQVSDHVHGRALGGELQASLDADEETHWKVISFDAETDGLLLESVEHPGFDLVLANGATHFPDASTDVELTLAPRQVQLEFEPHLPIGVPTAVLEGRRAGVAFTPKRDVSVVARRGDHVLGDLDGDGAEDVEAVVLSDVAPFTSGEHITMGLLHSASPRWVYVNTLSTEIAEPVVKVRCEVLAGDDSVFAVELEGDNGRRGRLSPLDGVALSEYQDGDVVFAVETSGRESTVSWLALSSAIREAYTAANGHGTKGNDGEPQS